MARVDTFITQLFQHQADCVVMEAGGTISLVQGAQSTPLMNVRKGEFLNDHVVTLVREIADPRSQQMIAEQKPCVFEYASPAGPCTVEFIVKEHQLVAKISRAKMGGAVSDGLNVTSAYAHGAQVAEPEPTPVPEPKKLNIQPSAGEPAIHRWFTHFIESGASDLHLTAGKCPAMRLDGGIVPLGDYGTPHPDELAAMLMEILPPHVKAEFEQTHDADFAYELGGARLRGNVFLDRYGMGAVFRIIPSKITSLDELGAPEAVRNFCRLTKGLVLVTGPTGSGKSTTLAAMMHWINEHREEHIITLEDPIEFVHEPIKCIINQRQVGVHTASFARGLRAALREDPDIILVGEMRDLETISAAIEMAETGHLVLGTLHTTTAVSTMDRIVDQFPPDQQSQIRVMLASALKGVISQNLLKRRGGGRVAAYELLVVTGAVANLIREQKTVQAHSVMQTSKNIGMVTMDESLLELVRMGTVEPEEAFRKAIDKETMGRVLKINASGELIEPA